MQQTICAKVRACSKTLQQICDVYVVTIELWDVTIGEWINTH